jgi:hypothetical protein
VNVIDANDPVPKYYKNENVAHANTLVHIDRNDPCYRHIGMFEINWDRFNPLNQAEKFRYDYDNLEAHYMKNYISVCHEQFLNPKELKAATKKYKY